MFISCIPGEGKIHQKRESGTLSLYSLYHIQSERKPIEKTKHNTEWRAQKSL